MFADLTLVDESGGTLTSALAATRRTDIGAPAELLARAFNPAARMMQVSAPLIGKVSGERSLLLARAVDLPGAPPLVALAEVPSSLLLSVQYKVNPVGWIDPATSPPGAAGGHLRVRPVTVALYGPSPPALVASTW